VLIAAREVSARRAATTSSRHSGTRAAIRRRQSRSKYGEEAKKGRLA